MEDHFNTYPLLISFGPVIVINVALFISLLYYWISGKNKVAGNAEGAKRYRSKFLSSFFKSWWLWNVNPVARFFVKLKIGPNLLTFFGFLFSLVAGILFALGLFGYAGWAVIFGASFDIFDGYVARLTGKSSRSGAYFDSVVDRFGEGAAFIGLAYYFRDSWVLFFVLAGLVGSMMVSYTRARGEGVGVVCKKGSMQRPERIVYMGVGAVLTPFASLILSAWWASPLPILVIIAQIIIAVGTLGTSIYRMVYIMNELDAADKKGLETLPQIITRLSTSEGREEFFKKALFGYDRSRSQFTHVVTVMADALSDELFSEISKKGNFPNMSALVEKGSKGFGIASFPALSGISSAPLVTGCFPGTCNIPGVRWFDRRKFRDYSNWGSYAMDYDLSDDVQTIFEYSRKAVNIFGPLNRGCGLIRDPAFFRWHHLFKMVREEGDNSLLIRAGKKWFSKALLKKADYIFFNFSAISLALERGENKEGIYKACRELDELIGWMRTALDEAPGKDGYAFTLTGGNGFTRSTTSFDISEFVSKSVKTFTYPGVLRGWLESGAVLVPSGGSMCHIYLRGDDGWGNLSFTEDGRVSDLLNLLLERNEIEFVAGRSRDGGIVVKNKRGSAHIIEGADGNMKIDERGDPFEFKGVIKGAFDQEELLKNTSDKKYPIAPLQFLQIFRSLRAGDVVVVADAGCDMRQRSEGKSPYLTGTLDSRHVGVPILSSLKLPEVMETAAVFAINLESLGIKARHKLDSTVLAGRS